MRKLELITSFAILAAATPAMAQGRGHEHGHGLGVGGVPPGQVVAAQHRHNDRDGDDDDVYDRNRGNDPNGGSNLPNGAVVLPNGQVVYPTGTRNSNGGVYYPDRRSRNGSVYYPNGTAYPNGQQCTQVADRDGNVRTVCRNQRGDGDEDDRFQRAGRQHAKPMKFKKAKKHHDRDRDGDDR